MFCDCWGTASGFRARRLPQSYTCVPAPLCTLTDKSRAKQNLLLTDFSLNAPETDTGSSEMLSLFYFSLCSLFKHKCLVPARSLTWASVSVQQTKHCRALTCAPTDRSSSCDKLCANVFTALTLTSAHPVSVSTAVNRSRTDTWREGTWLWS